MALPGCPDVSVQEPDFDVSSLQLALQGGAAEAGAIASFTGLVRAGSQQRQVAAMELEHYPGMTERSIQKIVDEARQRWQLLGVRVVHRVGKLAPGDQIVYVGVSSSGGEHWVDSRDSDFNAARRWEGWSG
jgi:molybdopterin synthase catalytic subunit